MSNLVRLFTNFLNRLFLILFLISVVCEVCGQSILRIDYDRHFKGHREKRVEVCQICSKAFTNISNFKYHMAHHGTERPWLCNEQNCQKTYKTKIDLLQHQR